MLLRYTRLNVEMYTADTAKAAVKSHDQMQWVQVYCTARGCWVKAYPMARNADTPLTLQDLLKEVGAPYKLILDNSLHLEHQNKGNFRKMIAWDAGIRIIQTEPYSPWQSRAELAIRELKKATRRRIAR
jgi:hypothetical protein